MWYRKSMVALIGMSLLLSASASGEEVEQKPVATEEVEAPDLALLLPEDLVEGFASEPVTSLYYSSGAFPDGLKEAIALGRSAVPALVDGSFHCSEDVRFTSLVALNDIALDATSRTLVVPAMLNALRDNSTWVRTEAAWGLGILRTDVATDALIELLGDGSKSVVQEALVALDKIHYNGLPTMTSSLGLSDERVASLRAEWQAYAEAMKAGRDATPPSILPARTEVEKGENNLTIILPQPITLTIVEPEREDVPPPSRDEIRIPPESDDVEEPHTDEECF